MKPRVRCQRVVQRFELCPVVDDGVGEQQRRARHQAAADLAEEVEFTPVVGQEVHHEAAGRGVEIALDQQDRVWNRHLQATPVAMAQTPAGPRLVELGELVTASRSEGSHSLFRRNGRSADMVMAELAGAG